MRHPMWNLSSRSWSKDHLGRICGKMQAMTDKASARVLHGRLVGVTGKAYVAGVDVWLAVQTTAGEPSTLESITDDEGFFSFDLPSEPLHAAKLGAVLEGVQPLDLKPKDEPLKPGEIMLFVDDFVPSHLKYAG